MLEQTDAITNEVLEPITFVLAYTPLYVILFYLLPWRWKQPDYPPTHPRRQYSSWGHI